MDGSHFVESKFTFGQTIIALHSLADVEAQLALTEKTQNEAFLLRHRGYLSYGYITPRPEGIFFDKYDGRRNARTVVLYRNRVPAATIRVCLYDGDCGWPDADHLPAMEIFDDEIRQLQTQLKLAEGAGRVIEITRFARDPAFANDRTLIIAAFRIVAYLRLYFGAGIMLNAVRPHHMPMYQRLGFRKIEEPRKYPNLTYSAGLMAMFSSDYDVALRKVGFSNGISANDSVYASLVAGERVRVFQTEAGEERVENQLISMAMIGAK